MSLILADRGGKSDTIVSNSACHGRIPLTTSQWRFTPGINQDKSISKYPFKLDFR